MHFLYLQLTAKIVDHSNSRHYLCHQWWLTK